MGKYFINSPARPGQKRRGTKAANVVAVDEIIGSAIFFEALAYDSLTESPSCNFLSAYSTTTIAPSTSNPTDNIRANNTTIFIVNPIIDKAKRPDKNEPGIEIPTKKPDLTPNAPSIIIKTKIIAAITLFCKLFNIVLMPLDWSWLNETLTDGGNSFVTSLLISFILLIVSIIFSPTLFETSIVTEFSPLIFA